SPVVWQTMCQQPTPAGRAIVSTPRTRSVPVAEQLAVVARDNALRARSGERRAAGTSEEIRRRESGAVAGPWRQDHGASARRPGPCVTFADGRRLLDGQDGEVLGRNPIRTQQPGPPNDVPELPPLPRPLLAQQDLSRRF